jgi:hypothetical protein
VLPKEGSHTKENTKYPRVQKFWVLSVQERLLCNGQNDEDSN